MNIAKQSDAQLLSLFHGLSTMDKKAWLSCAENLRNNAIVAKEAPDFANEKPNLPVAPKDETVVVALKCLSASFPMLDKSKLLNQAAQLRAQQALVSWNVCLEHSIQN